MNFKRLISLRINVSGMEKRTLQSTYYSYANHEALPEQDQQLIRAARYATSNAYAPYSKFRVGAALLMDDGAILTGSNQENASSPVGTCAEKVVFSTASATMPGTGMRKLVVAADSQNKKPEPVAPCGLCRQTILEYEERFQRSIEILMVGEDNTVLQVASVRELLPLPFLIRKS